MITSTYTLISAVKKMYPVIQFLHNRYFPDGKSFYSDKVLIETKKQGRKVAPFVIPQVNGITLEAQGYRQEEVTAPYIAPKMPITAEELEKKAFGESPESGRSAADRENEVETEHLDDLRHSVAYRHEEMDAEILTTGEVVMNHYATANDAAKGVNAKQMVLRFYEHEFKNKYRFTKDFSTMTAGEKILEFYKMVTILRKRGVKATDIVMTSDVSALLMSDEKFLEFYNKERAILGNITPVETPDGVASLGTINVNGVLLTLFAYDEEYEDLDGQLKPIFPKGTIALLYPGMGTTSFGAVSFVADQHFQSHADPFVPRLVASEENNVIEVQAFSRPVPYPFDWDGWLVANIYDAVSTQDVADNSVDIHEGKTDKAALKTEAEIKAMKNKADIIAYAKSIGLDGLDNSLTRDDLIDATISYQKDIYGE